MSGHMREKPPGSGRWELIAYEGQDASGRKRQRSKMTPKDRRMSKREAARERDRWALEVADQRDEAAANSMTVAGLLDRWLTHITPAVKESTLYAYRSKVVRMKAALGHLAVTEVTHRDVERFYDAMLAEGLSPSTVATHHDVLRVAFGQAVRWGELDVSPVERAQRPKVQHREAGVLSLEDEALILAACDTYDPDLGTFARLAAATGARRGELCGLRWPNVDLERQEIHLRTAVARAAGSHETTLKSGRSRTVAIDDEVVTLLRVHAERMEARALFAGVEVADRGYVFSRDPRCLVYLNPNIPSEGFRAVRKAIVEDPDDPRPDLAWVRLHDLRHSMASIWLMAGVPVPVVSQRLGHTSTQMTLNTYAHVMPGAGAEGLAKVRQFRENQGRTAHQ